MSIAFGVGVECLAVEIPDDRALLQESTEITFSDEDMEVGYPDHRRPFYLVASINQIPIKRALVDTSASVNLIPLSTLQVARISERKIQGCPMEDRIWRKGRVHCGPRSAMAESRPHSFSSSVPCSENRG